MGNLRLCAGRGLGVVNHVPDHAFGDGCRIDIVDPLHADRLGAAACVVEGMTSAHSGEAEVVAEDRNARFPDVADDLLEMLHLGLLIRAVQQNVVPVGGIEVFHRLKFEARAIQFCLEGFQTFD